MKVFAWDGDPAPGGLPAKSVSCSDDYKLVCFSQMKQVGQPLTTVNAIDATEWDWSKRGLDMVCWHGGLHASGKGSVHGHTALGGVPGGVPERRPRGRES